VLPLAVLLVVAFGLALALVPLLFGIIHLPTWDEMVEMSSGRVSMWLQKAAILADSSLAEWLFGHGEGSDWIVSEVWWWSAKDSHNDFIRLLNQQGLVGLGLVLAMLVTWAGGFRRAWRRRCWPRWRRPRPSATASCSAPGQPGDAPGAGGRDRRVAAPRAGGRPMSPRGLLQRFEVLAVTAAPGGQRLLHFALVQAVCGTEALGRFANDLSIAMMLGLFSAVGWSALVLARVPVAAGQQRAGDAGPGPRRRAVHAAGLPALPLLAWGGWVFEPAWTALLLAGWTAYTLARHYGLALACYRRLLVLETVLVVLLVAGLGLFGDGRPWLAYAALAVPTALSGRRAWRCWPCVPRRPRCLPAGLRTAASRRPSISSAAACRWCWCRARCRWPARPTAAWWP
jgi:hypothetical protein